MTGIRFLELYEVVEIHADLITRYGGFQGLRDMGLLQSALAAPQAGAGDQYLHEDPFEMAAAYLFHIVQNHPFVDGNKRTAAMAAFTFLKLNGYLLEADELLYEQIILDVAQSRIGKAEAAAFFRKHVRS